ncbi:MAG: hypothetical protein CXZ00_13675 [Acidobacteria bacterium]|nr:MAG: hypothetical protein CXZ00_13675 [Acidobacteriota bacterium]
MTAPVANYAGSSQNRRDLCFSAILAGFTLLTRLLCRGSLYFADGPAHIESIVGKSYVIQPPGYWLFNSIAGLFHDPVLAITAMNIFFSVAGVVVFYYVACFFTERRNAFLGAWAYSTVFYVWFSGEVHSTYASQILFPVATFYTLLRYERDREKWMLWLAAGLFAFGAGLRPSDGAFMIPMVLYFATFRLQRKESFIFLSLISMLCLSWVIPTCLAFHNCEGGLHDTVGYLQYITTCKSILTGVNAYTLANVTRYALPVLVAFWPVIGTAALFVVRNWTDWRVKALVIWIVPGSVFFVLVLITDPTYLNFLSAAVLLLAVTAPRNMIITALWNAVLFLAVCPIPSQKLVVNVANCYVLQYTRYGIQHHWSPRLAEMQKKIDWK